MNEHEIMKGRAFSKALQEGRCNLLEQLAYAISCCTEAGSQGVTLSDEGKAGMERIMEAFCAMEHGELLRRTGIGDMMILTGILTALCAAVLLYPATTHKMLGIYVEISYLLDQLLEGEWFE